MSRALEGVIGRTQPQGGRANPEGLLRAEKRIDVFHLSTFDHLALFIETVAPYAEGIQIRVASHYSQRELREAIGNWDYICEHYDIDLFGDESSRGNGSKNDSAKGLELDSTDSVAALLISPRVEIAPARRRLLRRQFAGAGGRRYSRRYIILGDGLVWDGSTRSRLIRRAAQPLARRLAVWRDRDTQRTWETLILDEGETAVPESGLQKTAIPQNDDGDDFEILMKYPHPVLWSPKSGNIVKAHVIDQFTAPQNEQFQQVYNDDYYARGILDQRRDWAKDLQSLQDDFWRRLVALDDRGFIAAAGKLPRRPRALDVGCGSGALAGRLSAGGFQTLGIDLSESAIALARREQAKPERAGLIGPDVEFRVAALEDLPPEPKYDLIALSHVIEHIADDIAFLLEIRRRLAPGGRLYVETTWASLSALRLRPDWWRQIDHCREYSKRGLAAALKEAGFQVLRHADAMHDECPAPYQFLLAGISIE